MVHQSFSTNDAFASLKRAVESWDADSNVACLLSRWFLSPLSIAEDTSFVTLHHLREVYELVVGKQADKEFPTLSSTLQRHGT
jgi:hypothetical protein